MLSFSSPYYLRWRAQAFEQEAERRAKQNDGTAPALRMSAWEFLERATFIEQQDTKEKAHG